MFTDNYINIINGTPEESTDSGYYSIKIPASIKDIGGNNRTGIFSTPQNVTDNVARASVFFLRQIIFDPYSFVTDPSAVSGDRMLIALATDTVDASDYQVDDTLKSFISATKSGTDIIVTVSNTSAAPISFNKIQCALGFNFGSYSVVRNFVLCAEFDVGDQTIDPGVSKSFRIVKEQMTV